MSPPLSSLSSPSATAHAELAVSPRPPATTARCRFARRVRASRRWRSVAFVLFAGLGSVAPAVAQVSAASADIGLSPGRARALMAGVAGLISVLIGGIALARSGRVGSGNGRAAAIVALVVGVLSVVLGGLHLAGSSGGFGTGSGRAGAIVALAVGGIGIVLGRLALTRSRRIG